MTSLPRAALHTAPAAASVPASTVPAGPDYLLVDGYNVIFAWDDLRKIAAETWMPPAAG